MSFMKYSSKISTSTKKYTKKELVNFRRRREACLLSHLDIRRFVAEIQGREDSRLKRGVTDSEWRLDFQEMPWPTFFPAEVRASRVVGSSNSGKREKGEKTVTGRR